MTFRDYAEAIKRNELDETTAVYLAVKAGKGTVTYCTTAIGSFM